MPFDYLPIASLTVVSPPRGTFSYVRPVGIVTKLAFPNAIVTPVYGGTRSATFSILQDDAGNSFVSDSGNNFVVNIEGDNLFDDLGNAFVDDKGNHFIVSLDNFFDYLSSDLGDLFVDDQINDFILLG